MCGICAYLGNENGTKYVLEGIQLLRNRGYDSMGCVSIKNSKFNLTKYSNHPEDSCLRLKQNFDAHDGAKLLISHCRWATTGKPTDLNSHPHLDTIFPNRLAIVHNGIINNYSKLKDFLLSKNVSFRSETDTEVIVNLIAYFLNKNNTLEDAIKIVLKELDGTWALVIADKENPSSLYLAKRGSPLLIGYDDDMCIVSSEISGFSNYLKTYHIVEENQLVRISIENSQLQFYNDDNLTKLSSKIVDREQINSTSPDPYPHWTIKEIMEQSDSVLRALNMGGRIYDKERVFLGGLDSHKKELMEIQNLTIIGSGTSFYAGAYGLKLFQLLSGFNTVNIIDASEFGLDTLSKKYTGVLVLSQSGETRDVINCMEIIRKHRQEVLIFSIVNVVDSLIARSADCGVYLNAGREVGVASTKSFLNQVVVLYLIAIWFAQNREINLLSRQRLISSLSDVSSQVKSILKTLSQCDKFIDILKTHHRLFILGTGLGYPIALEGALKIKEISYIHAEAYPGGGLKHGPLALIEEGTPVIIIGDKLNVALEEVKSRGAKVIKISNMSSDIRVPKGLEILSVIPLQYIAYKLSVTLGYPVDTPRNLAKVVTVH